MPSYIHNCEHIVIIDSVTSFYPTYSCAVRLSSTMKLQYSLEVSWTALADINGFAPSEDSRKHINSVWVPTAH